jgi:1,4-alpha-glucan branching enzyme
LFMGEEWGSSQPFPYFCDFEGDLGEKIRKGRREEFASFPEFKDPEQRDRIPDPLARETFLSAKLDWAQAGAGVHAEWLAWYRRILNVRHGRIVRLLQKVGGFAGRYHILGDGAVLVCWTLESGEALVLAANLSNDSVDNFKTLKGDVLWNEGPEPSGSTMRPWSVRWLIASAERHDLP